MYKKFNLLSTKLSDNYLHDISDDDVKRYETKMIEISEGLFGDIESLSVLEDGAIDGTSVINKWFPDYEADIFLSHSHNDILLAIKTACWLEKHFGLKVFVDSLLWGYADDLLLEIDKNYTYNESSNTYNYKLRNISTAHVHMMLSTALNDMIDNTECIIFLNTPQSIEISNMEELTYSPWIYSEIKAANILRTNKPARLIDKNLEEEFLIHDGVVRNDAPKIGYQTDLSQFKELRYSALAMWKQLNGDTRGEKSLDILYYGLGG